MNNQNFFWIWYWIHTNVTLFEFFNTFLVFKNQKKQTGRKSQVAIYVRQPINSSSEKRGEYYRINCL